MREILFKAKRVDNGEWVKGYYVKAETLDGSGFEHFIIEESKDGATHKINPETLCQLTGLHDKHNNRIWENDIVITQPFFDRPYSDKRKSKQFCGIVEYQTRTFNGNKSYPKQVYQAKWGLKYTEEHGKFVHFSWGDLWGCEVIGNRFDNPELLRTPKNDEVRE